MRALTIHQPWASYIAWRRKQYETRSWPHSYRGLVAIHAGKSGDFVTPGMREHDPELGTITFPLGVVLAVGELTQILYTDLRNDPERVERYRITLEEQRLGDWSSGRYAWRFENVQLLREPVPMRGLQGLWRPTPEQVALIADQLPSPG